MHQPIYEQFAKVGRRHRVQRVLVPKVLWRLAPVAFVAVIVVVLSISHIMRAGATAVLLYMSTRNEHYVEREHHTERLIVNRRSIANALWVANDTTSTGWGESSLLEDLNWSVGVTFANVDKASVWSLRRLGLTPWFTRTVRLNPPSTVRVTLPPFTASHVMMYDVVVHHWGLLDTYENGRFTGTQRFDYEVPATQPGGIYLEDPTPFFPTIKGASHT